MLIINYLLIYYVMHVYIYYIIGMLITFMMITYSRCYYDTLNTYSTDMKLFVVSFTFLYCSFLWLLLSAFTTFHLWYLVIDQQGH